MVKNTKTSISSERDITFPLNKKILNLPQMTYCEKLFQMNKKYFQVLRMNAVNEALFWASTITAFAFHAKSFTVTILGFFFFPSFHFFWTDCQNIFREPFIISYQESVWPRSDSFLGHNKMFFCKKCSLLFVTRVAHDTAYAQ